LEYVGVLITGALATLWGAPPVVSAAAAIAILIVGGDVPTAGCREALGAFPIVLRIAI